MFPHAHTRPEFAEGVLRALQATDQGQITELAIGERSGITLPSRMTFAQSGFLDMLERLGGVKHYFLRKKLRSRSAAIPSVCGTASTLQSQSFVLIFREHAEVQVAPVDDGHVFLKIHRYPR